MVLVISRFRIANGKEEEVRQAFLDRPRLVENAAGFLGLEVLTENENPPCFHLLTRWTDVGAFEAWHASEEHRLSHQGIPAGLKLDPSFTKVVTLRPITEDRRQEESANEFAWMPPSLAGLLESSQSIHYIYLTSEGKVCACNRATLLQLKRPLEQIVGRNIGDLLTAPDAGWVRACLDRLRAGQIEQHLLNFVDANASPYSLECAITSAPEGFSLLGEPVVEHERQLSEELLKLNNQITVMARESARQKKELAQANEQLEKALTDLRTSYWHIQKIHEVLPICMECGKVKTTETRWEDVAQYLNKNFHMLSHGYCPECCERIMKGLEGTPPARSEG